MKKIYKLLGLLLLTSSSLLAQQESMITFYKDHLNLVNPAFNSVDGNTYISSSIRNQWSGIKDAPETQALSFMTPLGKNLSLGISYVHDRVFIEQQSFVAVDFSYRVRLNTELELFMGIKAGGNNYSVNSNTLETYNIAMDPALASISSFNPNIGAGFYLKHDKYFISLSSPRLLNTERGKNEDGYATVTTDRMHIYVSSGYTFQINEELAITPSFMTRYVNGSPFSTDINAMASFYNVFDVGATYRTDQSAVGLAKFTLNKRLIMGLAYEYSLRSELFNSAKGTTELFLQFKL
jgi:type IX secretion system PorP/SprF family membrane protein